MVLPRNPTVRQEVQVSFKIDSLFRYAIIVAPQSEVRKSIKLPEEPLMLSPQEYPRKNLIPRTKNVVDQRGTYHRIAKGRWRNQPESLILARHSVQQSPLGSAVKSCIDLSALWHDHFSKLSHAGLLIELAHILAIQLVEPPPPPVVSSGKRKNHK